MDPSGLFICAGLFSSFFLMHMIPMHLASRFARAKGLSLGSTAKLTAGAIAAGWVIMKVAKAVCPPSEDPMWLLVSLVGCLGYWFTVAGGAVQMYECQPRQAL